MHEIHIIEVNAENLEKEHICCAISDKIPTQTKKQWMAACFADGYRFKKFDGRGKAFLEVVPAENAWTPVNADGYLFIDCFWVSGSLAKQGIGTALFEEVVRMAKEQDKKGIVALSSAKKRPFLSDPKFYHKKGFLKADTAEPYFELLYLPFSKTVKPPNFKECAKDGKIADEGIVVYYTDHCPWTSKYIPVLEELAREKDAPFKLRKLDSKQEAQNAPSPFTTFAVYADGMFVTNEIFGPKKFIRFLEEKGY